MDELWVIMVGEELWDRPARLNNPPLPPPITASAGSGKDPSQWALVGGPWVGWAISVVFSNHSDAGDGGEGGVGRGVPAGLTQP